MTDRLKPLKYPQWRDWLTEPPRNPDAAFLGFCKKWYERRGPARR